MSVQAIAGLILNFTYVNMKGPNKTIESNKKDVSLVEWTTLKKNCNLNVILNMEWMW